MHCIQRSKDDEGFDSFAYNTTFLQSHLQFQVSVFLCSFSEIIIGNILVSAALSTVLPKYRSFYQDFY